MPRKQPDTRGDGKKKTRNVDLPKWAADMEPIGMAEAARVLGICVNTLRPYLKDFSYYERRGAKKVFYGEHIDALREAINSCSESRPILSPGFNRLAAPSGASVLERARRRATEKLRSEGAKELERARARLTEKRKRYVAATKTAMNMPDEIMAATLSYAMRDAVDYAAFPDGAERKRASRPHSLTLRALERRGMIAMNGPAYKVALTQRGRRILQMLRNEVGAKLT